MRGPIKRYSDYDREAREVLSRAAKLADLEGRPSLGLGFLRLGLLEIAPATEATLTAARIDPGALAAIDDESGTPGGVTAPFNAALAAAETAAILDGRTTVGSGALAAGLVAVTSRAGTSAGA